MFSVAVSLPCCSCVANLIGAGLPLICEKFQVDPAVIAAPCMTTLVDCVGILTYLKISGIIIGTNEEEEGEGEGGEGEGEGEAGCECRVNTLWRGVDGSECQKEPPEGWAPTPAFCQEKNDEGETAADACCLVDECWRITGGCAENSGEELSDENLALLAQHEDCDKKDLCHSLEGHEDWAIDPETCQLHPHAERDGDETINIFMMIVLLGALVFCGISGYQQWKDMQEEDETDPHAEDDHLATNSSRGKPVEELAEPVKYLVLNTATVRRGPDADSEKMGELKSKQMIECVEKTTNAAGLDVLRLRKKGDGSPVDGGWVKTVTSKGKQLLHQLPGAQFPGDPSPHIIPKHQIEVAVQEALTNLSLLPNVDIDAAKVVQQLANSMQVQVILQTDAHKHQRVLKSIPLLSNMTPVELRPIIESVEVLNFTAGQDVIAEDATDQDMYVVMEGTAVCTKLGANDGGPVAQYATGDFFGERAALANEPRAATVTADSDLTVLKLDRSAYNLVLDSANANVEVVHSLQKQYEQACGTPQPRVRRQQVNYARRAGSYGAHGGPSVLGAMRAARRGPATGRRGSDMSDSSDTPGPSLRLSASDLSSTNMEYAQQAVNAGANPGSPRRYSDPEVSASTSLHAIR
eukprot:COSAG02_NODE_52_length_44175_cov_97.989654_5_plen_636_part_00